MDNDGWTYLASVITGIVVSLVLYVVRDYFNYVMADARQRTRELADVAQTTMLEVRDASKTLTLLAPSVQQASVSISQIAPSFQQAATSVSAASVAMTTGLTTFSTTVTRMTSTPSLVIAASVPAGVLAMVWVALTNHARYRLNTYVPQANPYRRESPFFSSKWVTGGTAGIALIISVLYQENFLDWPRMFQTITSARNYMSGILDLTSVIRDAVGTNKSRLEESAGIFTSEQTQQKFNKVDSAFKKLKDKDTASHILVCFTCGLSRIFAPREFNVACSQCHSTLSLVNRDKLARFYWGTLSSGIVTVQRALDFRLGRHLAGNFARIPFGNELNPTDDSSAPALLKCPNITTVVKVDQTIRVLSFLHPSLISDLPSLSYHFYWLYEPRQIVITYIDGVEQLTFINQAPLPSNSRWDNPSTRSRFVKVFNGDVVTIQTVIPTATPSDVFYSIGSYIRSAYLKQSHHWACDTALDPEDVVEVKREDFTPPLEVDMLTRFSLLRVPVITIEDISEAMSGSVQGWESSARIYLYFFCVAQQCHELSVRNADDPNELISLNVTSTIDTLNALTIKLIDSFFYGSLPVYLPLAVQFKQACKKTYAKIIEDSNTFLFRIKSFCTNIKREVDTFFSKHPIAQNLVEFGTGVAVGYVATHLLIRVLRSVGFFALETLHPPTQRTSGHLLQEGRYNPSKVPHLRRRSRNNKFKPLSHKVKSSPEGNNLKLALSNTLKRMRNYKRFRDASEILLQRDGEDNIRISLSDVEAKYGSSNADAISRYVTDDLHLPNQEQYKFEVLDAYGSAILNDTLDRLYEMSLVDRSEEIDFDDAVDLERAERDFFGKYIEDVDAQAMADDHVQQAYSRAIATADPTVFWEAVRTAERGIQFGSESYMGVGGVALKSSKHNASSEDRYEALNTLRSFTNIGSKGRDYNNEAKSAFRNLRTLLPVATPPPCDHGSRCCYLEPIQPTDALQRPEYLVRRKNHLDSFSHGLVSKVQESNSIVHETKLLTGYIHTIEHTKVFPIMSEGGHYYGTAFRCGPYMFTAWHVIEMAQAGVSVHNPLGGPWFVRILDKKYYPGKGVPQPGDYSQVPLGFFKQFEDTDLAYAPVVGSKETIPGFTYSPFVQEYADRSCYSVTAVLYDGRERLTHSPITKLNKEGFNLSYVSDTMGGMSGAPVYCSANGCVLGVHLGGSADTLSPAARCFGYDLQDLFSHVRTPVLPTNIIGQGSPIFPIRHTTHSFSGLYPLARMGIPTKKPKPVREHGEWERLNKLYGPLDSSGYGMSSPTPFTNQKDFLKYDKLESCSDSHCYQRASSYLQRMFEPFLTGYCLATHEQVIAAMERNKGNGYPLSQVYPKSGPFLDAHSERLQQAFDDWQNGNYFRPFATNFGKREVRPQLKLDLGKIRTICCFQRDFLYISMRYFHLYNLRFYTAAGLTWSQVGFTPFYLGWNKQTVRLIRRKIDQWMGRDFDVSEFDSSQTWQSARAEVDMRYFFLHPDYKSANTYDGMLEVAHCMVFVAVLVDTPDGVILYYKCTGVASGQCNTVVINTSNSIRATFYAILRAFSQRSLPEPSYQDILDNVDAVMYGDDNTIVMSPLYQRLIGWDFLPVFYGELGMRTTTDTPQPTTADKLIFLGMKTVVFRKWYVFYPDPHKMMASLRYGGGGVLPFFARLCGIYFISFFGPIAPTLRLCILDMLRQQLPAAEMYHSEMIYRKDVLCMNLTDSEIKSIYLALEGSGSVAPNYLLQPTIHTHIIDIMPFCTSCGLKVDDTHLFCRNCGARQKEPERTFSELPPVLRDFVPQGSFFPTGSIEAKSESKEKPDDSCIYSTGPEQYGCAICNVGLSGHSAIFAHLTGRLHSNAIANQRTRYPSVRPPSSVVNRGYAKPTYRYGEAQNPGPFSFFEKLKFKYYGNWGGPGYGGASFDSTPDWSVPAIDELDETFKEHDYDYGRMDHVLADRIWLEKAKSLPFSLKGQLARLGFHFKANSTHFGNLPSVSIPTDYPWKVVRYGEADNPGPGSTDPFTESKEFNDNYNHNGGWGGDWWDEYDPSFSGYEQQINWDEDGDLYSNLYTHSRDVPLRPDGSSEPFQFGGDTYRVHDQHNRDNNARTGTHFHRKSDDGHRRMAVPNVPYVPPEQENKRIGEASNPGPPLGPGIGSMMSTSVVGRPLRVRNVGQTGILVEGTDYLGALPSINDLDSDGKTPGVVLFNQPLGVNFGGIYSRVTRMAKMYEQYYVEYFELIFVPDVGTANSSGLDMLSLIMYIDPDVEDDPQGISDSTMVVQNGINQKGAHTFPAWQESAVTTDFKQMNGGWRWCSDTDATDPHMVYFGRSIVATANVAPSYLSKSPGTLYVSWGIRFRTPSGINLVPNQGLAITQSGGPTSPSEEYPFGTILPNPFWNGSFELSPLVSIEDSGTAIYPLQKANTTSGEIVTAYSPSDQYFLMTLRFEGTHFATGTGIGVGDTGPIEVNFTDFGGYGCILITGGNFNPAVWCFANGAKTLAMAAFMYKVPMNCDPQAYFTLALRNDGTPVTVANAGINIFALPSIMQTYAPLMSRVYPKNPDGTINHALNRRLRQQEEETEENKDTTGASSPLLVAPGDLSNPSVLDPVLPLTSYVVSSPFALSNCPVLDQRVRPKDKTVRYGEAKNPGPNDGIYPTRGPSFRVLVHNCAKQISHLQGRLPPHAVKQPPARATRDFQSSRVVSKNRPSLAFQKRKNPVQVPQVQQRSKPAPKRAKIPNHKNPVLSKKRSRKVRRPRPKPIVPLLPKKKSNKGRTKPKKKFVRIGEAKNPGPHVPYVEVLDFVTDCREMYHGQPLGISPLDYCALVEKRFSNDEKKDSLLGKSTNKAREQLSIFIPPSQLRDVLDYFNPYIMGAFPDLDWETHNSMAEDPEDVSHVFAAHDCARHAFEDAIDSLTEQASDKWGNRICSD